MSPSTADTAPVDCILSIVPRSGDSDNVRIIVASASTDTASEEIPTLVPGYIDTEGSQNIDYIEDKKDVNDTSPIQVYLGGDPDISPILLLEETDYDILLQGEVDEAFPYLFGNSGNIALKHVHFHGADGGRIYKLRFKSYVGKGFFDIVRKGSIISVPFEVRSRKIGYLDEYPTMLEDIAEFSTSILLDRRSPLYTEYSLSEGRGESLYEDFLVLEHVFSNLDLGSAFEIINSRPHTDLSARSETVPAGIAGYVDPSDLIYIISPDNLFQMDSGPIAGSFAPLEMMERRYEDDYDVPENRVVKDLLLTISNMVESMIADPRCEESTYISNRLNEMRADIRRMLSASWLSEVGDITSIPFSSNILRERSGYAEAFIMYQVIGLGVTFRQADVERLLNGHNTRLYQVYEYWCYTRLYRTLWMISVNKPDFPLKKDTKGRWDIGISRSKGVNFILNVNGTVLNIRLLYNRRYSPDSKEFRSYSVPLRPDFTLIISNESAPDHRFLINFDAKYKAKPKQYSNVDLEDDELEPDSWEFDIYKMHTYRDALIHSLGSYVLFPGKVNVIYPKPVRDEPWKDRTNHMLPSVGAIPLVPGSKNDRTLNDVLDSILSEISEISSDEVYFEPE